MTPEDLRSTLTNWQEVQTPAEDDDSTTDYDTAPDLWEALDLLGKALEHLEHEIKIDNDCGFLTKLERADLLTHTAEVLTFLDQWTFPDDDKAKSNIEVVIVPQTH